MVRQKKAVKRKPGRKPWASGTKLAFLERHLDDFHRTPQKHRGRLYDRVALKFRAKYGADFNYDKDDLEEDTPDPTTFPYEQDTTNMTEEEAERSDAYFDRLRDVSATFLVLLLSILRLHVEDSDLVPACQHHGRGDSGR